MIKDLLISFKDNIKSKSTNPFWGTLIIVWTIKNWNLIYSIFNFDAKTTLSQKISFVVKHFTTKPFLETLGICVLDAFAVIIVSYSLVNLSRLIINFYEKRLTPLIYKWTDSNSIVLKSVYEELRIERDDLQSRLDTERDSKSKLEIRIKSLEEDIVQAKTIKDNKGEPILDSKNTKEQPIEVLSDVDILYKKLRNKNLVTEFVGTATLIQKGELIAYENKFIDDFIQLGLVKFTKDHDFGAGKHYGMTTDGNAVLKKIRFT